MDDFIYQNAYIYLQRGKLKKRFNSLSKRKFHLANLTSMRKTKFFFFFFVFFFFFFFLYFFLFLFIYLFIYLFFATAPYIIV